MEKPTTGFGVQTAILVGLGVYFGNLVFSDNLRNYSNQPAWLVLSAAAVFLALGLASGSRILPIYSKSPAHPDRDAHDEIHIYTSTLTTHMAPIAHTGMSAGGSAGSCRSS